MGLSSVITAGILSGALVFGQTASETEFPKEIDEVTYNLVPVYVQEINWSDDSSKLNKLHTKSYTDENGVLHFYGPKDYTDNSYDLYAMAESDISAGLYNGVGDNNGGSDENDEISENDSSSMSNNNIGDDIGNAINRKSILYSDMQELIKAYKAAGYSHTVVRFPVTKDEPYYKSKSDFLNQIPFGDIEDIAIYGYASPDGRIPEMQEALAEKRRDKVNSFIKKENITVKNTDFFVCDKSVTRSLCWKVDVFYKTGER